MIKKWHHSKTLWTNLIGIIAIVVQTQTGFVINPATQAGILAIVNTILRSITKEPVKWKG